MRKFIEMLSLVVASAVMGMAPHAAYAQDRDHPINLPRVVVVANAGVAGNLGWNSYSSYQSGGPDNSIGVGTGGGGSEHTSSNTHSTANQKNSKNPKPGCDDNDATASTTTTGDPIDTSTGSKIEKVADFAEPGEMGLTFERYYNSRFSCVGSNAPCTASVGAWTTNLDYRLDDICYSEDTGGSRPRPIRCGPVTFTRPDGSSLDFSSTTAFFGAPNGAPVPGPFNAVGTATLTNNGDGTYTVRDEDADTLNFDNQGNLLSIKDPSGIGWTLTHPDGNTTIVTHTNGMSFKVALAAGSNATYGSAKQINVTDPAGNVYVYQATVGVSDSFTNPVSHIGVVRSETLPGSPSIQIGYQYLPDNASTGTYGQLDEVDYNGVAHDVTSYDSAGRANMSSMADGTQKTTIVYGSNELGPTAIVTNALGHVSIYQYDSNQLLLSVTGNASTHCAASFANNTYDANGNLTSSADNNGNTTTYSYAASGLLQQKVEAAGTAAQRTTDVTWDTTAGMDRPLSIKVEGLSETDFTYDSHNRLASQTLKNLTAVGTAQQTLTTTYAYTYNALGLPGQISGPNGDVTSYSYDARGRITSIVRHPNGVTATWSYTYDGFGLPAGATAPDNSTSSVTRNPYMQVISITHNDKDGTSTETFAYDANGDVITHTIARGSDIGMETTASYDALGRLYQQLGMHGQTLPYAYDLAGHVVKVTDPRWLVTTYAYDGLGLVWNQVSPDTGTTTFAYDAYGRRSGMTRADGVATAYGYDALNRRTSVSAGGQTQSFAYDSCTHGLGRLCADSDATGTTSYAYTPEGWVSSRSFAIGGTTYALGYGYDSAGHLASVVYPDGNQAHYAYTDGVVSGVTLNVGGSTVNGATAISYRPGDAAMAGWTSSNGLVNTLGHDSDGRLTSISVPGIESLSFSYDAGNRITQIANGIDSSMTQTVGYDAMARITSLASTAENESYQYDADGNRLSSAVNGAPVTYTPDANSNRLASVVTTYFGTVQYGYDAQGNTSTTNGSVAYQYNPFNRLSQSGGATFYINPEGQRLRKAGGSTGTTYFAPDLSGALLAENDNGTWVDYVRLNGRLIGRISAGQVDAIHTDQVDRPDTVTDPSRNVIWHAKNYPFSSTVTLANITLNLGFPGQYYDAETWLWNNGYRDYSSGFGRYIESDPIGLVGGVNTYAYVGGNPLTGVDPLGLQCTTAQRILRAIGNFVYAHSDVTLTLDASDGIGFDGSLTLARVGTGVQVSGRTGIGIGIGVGAAVTANAHVGDPSGFGVEGSVAGGDAFRGGAVSAAIADGGPGASAGIGIGLGAGATATVGYSGDIGSFHSASAVAGVSGSGCGCGN